MRWIGTLSATFAIILALGCGGASPAEVDEESPPPPSVPGPGPHFSVLPIPIERLVRITPLGHNNKTLPNNGTYWSICDENSWLMPSARPCIRERLPLRAPRDAVVNSVDPVADGGISLEGPPGLFFGYGHVTPTPGLVKGDSVKAGDVVATMFYDHLFDVTMHNLGVTPHQFVNSARASTHYSYAQHAIEQYPEPLRSQLISRVQTTEDPIGRLSWDVAGTASGSWFLEGTPPNQSLTFTYFPNQLFLGPLAERHSSQMFAVGTLWANQINTHMMLDSSVPALESITPSSGVVAMRAWFQNRDGTPNTDIAHGTVLVQVLTGDRMRVEWFNTHAPVLAFTAASRIYVR